MKWHNKRKCSGKSPFQSIPGSKAMLCNFQFVKCLDNMWNKIGGGWEAEFQESIRKEWANLQHRGSLWFWILLPVSIKQWQARLGKFKACLSSDKSESEKQKSQTRQNPDMLRTKKPFNWPLQLTPSSLRKIWIIDFLCSSIWALPWLPVFIDTSALNGVCLDWSIRMKMLKKQMLLGLCASVWWTTQ